jgi:hypothetical protein
MERTSIGSAGLVCLVLLAACHGEAPAPAASNPTATQAALDNGNQYNVAATQQDSGTVVSVRYVVQAPK